MKGNRFIPLLATIIGVQSILGYNYTSLKNNIEKDEKTIERVVNEEIELLPFLTSLREETHVFPTRLTFGGDVMNHRYGEDKIYYPSFEESFEHISDVLTEDDLSFINLEMSICSDNSFSPQPGIVLYGYPEDIKTMEEAGVDVVTLANNHSMNGGLECFIEMLDHLENSDITYVGAGHNLSEARTPRLQEVNGTNYIFLAYAETVHLQDNWIATEDSPGVAPMNIDYLEEDLEKAKELGDFIIVSMHAGYNQTQWLNSEQVEFSKAAITHGADLVIGHHSHIIQSPAEYQGRLIMPGLGNLIFDSLPEDYDGRQNILFEISVQEGKILESDYHLFYSEETRLPTSVDNTEIREDIEENINNHYSQFYFKE